MCLPVILFLLIIPDRSLSQTCNTSNLYEEFKEKFNSDNELIKFEEDDKSYFYKCLAMYGDTPPFTITETNMEDTAKILRKKVDDLIYQIVYEPSVLTHDSDFITAFETTCFYSQLKNFVKKLREFLNQSGSLASATSIKLSCPLGLIYDIACSFASCLNTGCTVNGMECDQGEGHPYKCDGSPQISLMPFCKDEFEGFVRSCFFDDSDNQWASTLVATLNDTLTNSNCQSLNFIYQGLTSLQVLGKSIITADCSQTKETVTLKCFKEGTYLSSVLSWYDDDKEVTRVSNWTIHRANLSNYGLISCQENGTRVAQITSTDLITLCKSVEEEEEEEAEEEEPTTISSTSSGQSSDYPHLKRKSFFHEDKTWLLEGYGNFNGMDAFNNKQRLAKSVGYLSVATVSVMGRLTPICGDLWNAAAAQVFCRDAGLQLREDWTATYVGVIQSSESERNGNEFYKHYIHNLRCKGSEQKLIWCEHDGWYLQEDCKHDAVVICYNNTPPPDPTPAPGSHDVVIIIVITVITLMAFVIILGVVLYHYCNGNLHNCGGIKLMNWMRVDDRSVVATDTTVDTSVGIVCSRDPSSSYNGSSNKTLTWSTFLNFGSVQRKESCPFPIPEEPTGDVGRVVGKRLNDPKHKEWVLLYEFPDSGGKFVCKSFHRDANDTRDNMITEQFFLSNVEHPNVVKCAHEPMNVKFDDQDKISFFMEYLELGSLDKYLRTKADKAQHCNGHRMTVDDATSIFVGACRALHYVHSMGYVHGDISSDNFFVYINPRTDRVDVKLGDFGSFYKPGGCRDVRRTPLYTAPELVLKEPGIALVLKEPDNEKEHCVQVDPFKNDVWGLGLVLWEAQSWVSCKNSSTARGSSDNRLDGMAGDSVCMRSRFGGPCADDYKECRRHLHIALLEKLNIQNSSEKDVIPTQSLMKDFYKDMYPHNISYPYFQPTLDDTFGWQITDLLKICLAVYPDKRPTMGDVLRYLTEREHISNSGTLSPYIEDILSDLTNNLTNTLNMEDADDELLSLQPPTTLQPLGQLY